MKLWNINDSSTQFLADSPSSLLPLIVSSVLFPTIQLRGTPNPQETVREWTSWLLFVHSKLSATFFLYWRLLDYLPGHMKLSTSKNYQLNSWCLYTVKKHWQLYGLSTDCSSNDVENCNSWCHIRSKNPCQSRHIRMECHQMAEKNLRYNFDCLNFVVLLKAISWFSLSSWMPLQV